MSVQLLLKLSLAITNQQKTLNFQCYENSKTYWGRMSKARKWWRAFWEWCIKLSVICCSKMERCKSRTVERCKSCQNQEKLNSPILVTYPFTLLHFICSLVAIHFASLFRLLNIFGYYVCFSLYALDLTCESIQQYRAECSKHWVEIRSSDGRFVIHQLGAINKHSIVPRLEASADVVSKRNRQVWIQLGGSWWYPMFSSFGPAFWDNLVCTSTLYSKNALIGGSMLCGEFYDDLWKCLRRKN